MKARIYPSQRQLRHSHGSPMLPSLMLRWPSAEGSGHRWPLLSPPAASKEAHNGGTDRLVDLELWANAGEPDGRCQRICPWNDCGWSSTGSNDCSCRGQQRWRRDSANGFRALVGGANDHNREVGASLCTRGSWGWRGEFGCLLTPGALLESFLFFLTTHTF